MKSELFQDISKLSTLEDKINALRLVEHLFPVAIIINDLTKNVIAHMSQFGLDLLDQKAEDVIGLEIETYHARYFNEEDSKYYMPKVYGLIKSETKESVSFFQQVRTSKTRDWDWYLSSLKLFHQDKDGKPVATIATAQKIDPNHYFTPKAESLLNENQFIKLNFNKFSSLTNRE